MATLVATKHDWLIRRHYRQLIERGKAKMTALVVCTRKLLLILNAMIKKQSPWKEALALEVQDSRYGLRFNLAFPKSAGYPKNADVRRELLRPARPPRGAQRSSARGSTWPTKRRRR
jgi:hypothetical protein